MNGDGTCFRNGEREDATNMIGDSGMIYDALQDHLEMLEQFYYECKKFKKCD